jgi:hypothetical protein
MIKPHKRQNYRSQSGHELKLSRECSEKEENSFSNIELKIIDVRAQKRKEYNNHSGI